MKTFDVITFILLLVGGINWGLVGLFDFDLVKALFGDMTLASRIVYTLVGLSALYELVGLRMISRRWFGGGRYVTT